MVVKSTYQSVMPSEASIVRRHASPKKKSQQQPTESGLPKTKMWKWNHPMEEISDDWTIWWWHFNKVSFSAWDEALRKRRVGSLSTVDGLKQLSGIRQNCLLTSQRCFGESVFFFWSCNYYLFFLQHLFCASLLPIIKRLHNWVKIYYQTKL